jgi:SAM-dependent methyltransferase
MDMQDILAYQGDTIREHTGLIQEIPRTHTSLFERKIENYLEKLRDFEKRCSQPDADEEKLFAEITHLNDSILEVCAQFEREVGDPLTIKKAQVYFREKTNPMLSKSRAIHRTRTWPKGQQGDYMTLELTYKNRPISEGIGYYLDKYLLSTSLGVGVRERIQKMGALLKEELKHRRCPMVLDIACGSCREVFELAPEIKSSEAKFTCVDLDPDALDFSLDRLAYAGLTSDHAELIQYNALRMFDPELAQIEFGMRDIIYSIGFFDYLPDEFLVKMLNSLYTLLNPGGKLIVAFKDAKRYRSQLFHWLVDWDGFLQRTENDFERIFKDAKIPESTLSMSRVKSGVIVFYTITK